eukprot:INCI15196.1.p1 GENE.INCI15196.1~~INCI15196.1.p1  ORF type:complete len:479 (+),score=75.50 INCI15196.1:149-1585(+)
MGNVVSTSASSTADSNQRGNDNDGGNESPQDEGTDATVGLSEQSATTTEINFVREGEGLVTFDAAHASFEELHASSFALVAEDKEPLFHEAGVWIPKTAECVVVSNRLEGDSEKVHVKIVAIHYPTGRVRRLTHIEDQIVMANGGTPDGKGGMFLCSQGLGEKTGSLWHVDATLSRATRVGPPSGLMLNSLNDVVLHHGSSTLLFTDPTYGVEAQGFRTSFNSEKAVWGVNLRCAQLESSWKIVNNCAAQPNGILLSPNEERVYVTDVWDESWHSNPQVQLTDTCGDAATGEVEGAAASQDSGCGERRCITVFDVYKVGSDVTQHKSHGVAETNSTHGPQETELKSAESSPSSVHAFLKIENRRSFVDLNKEPDAEGFPDGLACDEHGNVYTGCGDGARVYSTSGNFLGRIRVDGGVSNLCFAGPDGRTLVLLNETRAFAVQMRVQGQHFCPGRQFGLPSPEDDDKQRSTSERAAMTS